MTQLKKRAKLIQTLNAIPQDKHVELIKNLDTDSLSFLTRCMGCVLEGKSPHLKLKHHDKKLAHAAWKPYSKQMKLLVDSANQQMVVRKIRKQTGEGFLFTAILSAAIPLIANLISKLFAKRKSSPANQKKKKKKKTT